MKRCFGFFLVAICAVALMAGGAWGQLCESSTLDLNACENGDTSPDNCFFNPVPDNPDNPGTATGWILAGQEWLEDIPGAYFADIGNRRSEPCENQDMCSQLIYIPANTVQPGTIVTFMVMNGGLQKDQNYALWNCEPDVVAELATTDCDDGNCDECGYTVLKFAFSEEVSANSPLILSASNVGYVPPVFCFDDTICSDGPISIQVTAAELNTVPLCALTTQAENIAQCIAGPQFEKVSLDHRQIMKEYFDLNELCDDPESCEEPAPDVCLSDVNLASGGADSLIDIGAERKKFVEESDIDFLTDTTECTSKVEVLIKDNAEAQNLNEGICREFSCFEITLEGNQAAIENVEVDTVPGCGVPDDNVYLDEFPTYWQNSCVPFSQVDLTDFLENDVRITVDGDNMIECTRYDVRVRVRGTAYVNSYGGTARYFSWDNDGVWNFLFEDAFIWDYNGLAVRIPYMVVEPSDTFTSFFEITNRSDKTANVYADLVYRVAGANGDGGVDCGEEVRSCTPIVEVPPNCVTVVMEEEIRAFFDSLLDGESYQIGLTLYADVLQNEADASAYQKDATGRTAIPVLYKTNNVPREILETPWGIISVGSTGDGRQWQ
jgi:hypothetical protein